MKKFITFLSLFLGLSLCQSLFCANQEFLDFNREDCDFDLDLSPENPINKQNQDPLTTLENLLQDTSRDTDIDTAPEQQEENYLSLTQEEQEFILAQIASEAPQEAQEPHLSTLETIEPSASIPASESQAPTFTPKRPRIASKPLMSTLKPATPQEISSEEEEEEEKTTATTEHILPEGAHIENYITLSANRSTYTCLVCGKGMSHKSSAKNHILRKHTNKIFPCDQCDGKYAAKTLGDLQTHILYKHSNAKDFHCNQCNHATKTLVKLNRHKAYKHSRTRNFYCDQCDGKYAAKTFADLKSHILYKHSDVKNFPCDICKHTAKTPSDLLKHKKTHNKKTPIKRKRHDSTSADDHDDDDQVNDNSEDNSEDNNGDEL